MQHLARIILFLNLKTYITHEELLVPCLRICYDGPISQGYGIAQSTDLRVALCNAGRQSNAAK